jgi:outer membrane immunogenic protein
MVADGSRSVEWDWASNGDEFIPHQFSERSHAEFGGTPMRIRLLMIVMAAASAIAGSAYAADMPLKARPLAPVCQWCGDYFGINGGYVWGEKDVDLALTGLFLGDPTSPVVQQLGSPRLKHAGFSGGGQIGTNSQWGNWVVGLESDIQYMDLKFSRTTGELTPFGTAPGAPTYAFHEDEQDHWLATVRVRAGYANGPALVYVTGGLAFGQQDFSETFVVNNPGGLAAFGCVIKTALTSPTCVSSAGSTNGFAVGLTAGAGFEVRFAPNWSMKAEGLFVDFAKQGFDTALFTPPALGCAGCFAGFTTHVDGQLTAVIARLGINYQFTTASPAGVAAKY